MLELASRIESEIGKLKFREEIIEYFKPTLNVSSTFHNIISSLDVSLYITTNYDHLLEDAFIKNGIQPSIIVNDKDIPAIEPHKKTIVKLHGDINSPFSIVITNNDYIQYSKRFIEWLKLKNMEKTILFIGTSFEDPNLIKSDNHILSLFDDFRRNHFIFMKMPAKKDGVSNEDFEIELNDFNAKCNSMEERGFLVIQVEEYKEIEDILLEIQREVNNKNISAGQMSSLLRSEYQLNLEAENRKLIDEKILTLSERVRGNGRLPIVKVMLENTELLRGVIDNPNSRFSNESYLEGFLSISDAYLIASKGDLILKARKYFEKADEIYQKISNRGNWAERLLRVKSKLFFVEGKTSEALEIVNNLKENKSITFKLAFWIDLKMFEEAYNFITNRKIEVEWTPEALFIFISTGHIQEAENLFQKTKSEYLASKEKNSLNDSPYKGKSFYEKICCVMAEAFYFKAIKALD